MMTKIKEISSCVLEGPERDNILLFAGSFYSLLVARDVPMIESIGEVGGSIITSRD